MKILYAELISQPAGLRTHTRLYQLLPLNTGTPLIESLTGYITRLAEAHAVSVGALLREELLPRIPKGAPVGGKVCKPPLERQACLNGPHTLNGLTERAEHWVQLLQELTGVNDLRSLTMLPFQGICSSRSLLRKHRSWCPCCCEERHRAGEEAMEPLLWAIDMVAVCPLHRCLLSTTCPHCECHQPVLAGRSRPGVCWRCRKILRLRSDGERDGSAIAHQDLWIAENVGALLAACYAGRVRVMRDHVQRNLKNCISDLAGGNRSQLVRASQTKEKTLDEWLRGTFLPELSGLLRFCYRLRLPILRFLTETLHQGDRDWEQARALIAELGATRARRRKRLDVQTALQEALLSGQPASLAEIADEFGYRSISSLRRHDREACSIISQRQKTFPKSRPRKAAEQDSFNQMIGERLEAALHQDPPPSVRSMAIALGFADSNSLHCRFPELCNELVTAVAAAREKRRSKLELSLRAVLAENPPPSLKAVAARLQRKDIGSLRLWFPDLCRQITVRWRKERILRIRSLGAALAAASKEQSPPSGDLIAKEAGVSPSYLALLFPTAWRKLKARLLAAKKQAFAEQCEALRREVRVIATELCQQGIYPARRLVKSLIVASEYKSEEVISSEVRAVMSNLGCRGLAHHNPHR